MAKAYNWQAGRDEEIEDRFFNYMQEHGFEPWHSGGGIMLWIRSPEGPDGEHYTLISGSDSCLGEWRERNRKVWIVSRYNGETNAWNCFNPCVTLKKALALSLRIPLPVGDEQNMIESEKDLPKVSMVEN